MAFNSIYKTYLLAPDSFKDCMSSIEAINAMRKGIMAIDKNAVIIEVPIADGGEGTLNAIYNCQGGDIIKTKVENALGNTIETQYLRLKTHEAVVEMALVNGLNQIHFSERNPINTSTYGLGELIKSIIENGIKKITIGIGGSATNDGGVGMAMALGYTFYDSNGNAVPKNGKFLEQIVTIDDSQSLLKDKSIDIKVVCDVKNHLLGKNGATFVYGRQKGASIQELILLEKGLTNLVTVVKQKLKTNYSNIPGAGAAGGLGYGLLTFANAQLISGIDFIMQISNFEAKVKQADIVFSGEGSIDNQLLFGKALHGIANIAKKHKKPLHLFGGIVKERELLQKNGFLNIHQINNGDRCLEENILNGQLDLQSKVTEIVKKIN